MLVFSSLFINYIYKLFLQIYKSSKTQEMTDIAKLMRGLHFHLHILNVCSSTKWHGSYSQEQIVHNVVIVRLGLFWQITGHENYDSI